MTYFIKILFLSKIYILIPSPIIYESRYLYISVPLCQCSAMVCGAEDTWGAKLNGILRLSFMDYFDVPEFSVSLDIGSLDVKEFLFWVFAGTGAPKRAVVAELTEKRQHRASKQFTTGFCCTRRTGVVKVCYKASSAGFACFTFCVNVPWKRPPAFCTSSHTCSEMWMYQFHFWICRRSSRPCWRLYHDGPGLQPHFLRLVLLYPLRLRPASCFICFLLWFI